MKKRKHICMGAMLLLMSFLLSGCTLVDWTKNKVTDKVESIVVGEAKEVTSISTECYAYQQLSEEEQKVYDQLLYCILNHQQKVPISTKDPDALQRAYEGVMADYGGLFWISGYQYHTYSNLDQVIGMEFSPQYLYSQKETQEYQKKVDAVVEEWLAGVGPNDSDYTKSKYVFDILFQKVEYSKESSNNQNILSVFLEEKTVCRGYAAATQYLLQQLGVQSTIIHGRANGESHAWNLVKLDNEYYLTDATWGNSRYLMKDNSIQKQIDYRYMNATSVFFEETHVPDMFFSLPKCYATVDAYH